MVYQPVTANIKLCLALGGAKNHLMVLPGALTAMTAQNAIASMSGCTGQRCITACAMIGAGNIEKVRKNTDQFKLPH